ncbi:MAG: ferrochelatase [Bacteriovoracaceae bacterium]|nr:ferrochelatase [Bacteriovoracaceae bacterium]
MKSKTGIIFIQLGSPKSPDVSDVRIFLRDFLGDPRVIDLNPFLWKIILYLFILPIRPKKSAKLYRRIWDGKEFPLIKHTREFSNQSATFLDPESYNVKYSFILGDPQLGDVLKEMQGECDLQNLIFVSLFPQYSESTTDSVSDYINRTIKNIEGLPKYKFVESFHKSKAFIDHSGNLINNSFLSINNREDYHLICSFHGIPKRRVLYKADPYYNHCYETFVLLKDHCEIPEGRIHMTFQSRFGSEEWLTPYTEEYVDELIAKGIKKLIIYAPSFVSDCLENLDELGHELKKRVEAFGGELILIKSLNSDKDWCKSFSEYIVENNKNQLEYKVKKEELMNAPKQEMVSPPLSAEAKSSIKVVFFTLFLDLVGFSIIFPLFPSLAKHYLEVDSENYFLRLIFDSINTWLNAGGGNLSIGSIVLFGGALGAIYSLLQFIAAPIWGGISDRIGRKPVLMISITGLALSYLLWIFSGSFTVLILARFIGGIMGGNISTATAVVADVTQKENRSKGMAFVGVAFAFGFIFGPAIGGLSSLINLMEYFPSLVKYGLNPFSMPALIAFVLSVANILFLFFNFKESLPPEKRGKSKNDRSFNPIKLFKPLPYNGVNLTNIGHFLFLMAFSGMEFTLTFLAFERMSYTSMDNAYMFIFIGFIIALVQGGYVRRKAAIIGEKKMSLQGMILLIPGLILIGYAQSSFLLYVGLAFLAIGSSLIIPCLTSLVSIYTPSEYQGRSIGIFRSLGALARVFGPIIASITYWRFGSSVPYFAGALFLLIPLFLLSKLPAPETA